MWPLWITPKEKIKSLEKVNDLESYSHQNNVSIRAIPKRSDENLVKLVIDLCKRIDIKTDPVVPVKTGIKLHPRIKQVEKQLK